MPLPFDATLKDIVQHHVQDFVRVLHLGGPEPAVVLNVDLSTISAATDIALGYGEPPQLIDDLNFQSGFDPDLAARILLYNALLHYRYGVPVHSVVVLLRPAADDPGFTGNCATRRDGGAVKWHSTARWCDCGASRWAAFWKAVSARCHSRRYAGCRRARALRTLCRA